MKKLSTGCLLIGMAVLIIAVTPAFATLLTINNYSFESPAKLVSQTDPNVTGWTKTGSGGVWHPAFTVPDSVQIAFLKSGTLSQQLSDTIQTGATYTLSTYVEKYYANNNQRYRVQLYAVTGSGDVLLNEVYGIPALAQHFYQVSTVYTADSTYAGDPLKIELVAEKLSTTSCEMHFDLVTLDKAATVPIPASMLLFGTGLLGLGWLRRLKKQ